MTEKFFIKVLHEEPVAEFSLQDIVGGINVTCITPGALCFCNAGGSLECGDKCESNCPTYVEECSTDTGLGCPKNGVCLKVLNPGPVDGW